MLRQLVFRVIETMVRWHREYRNATIVKELHSCGSGVAISPDARIWGTHGVTLEDDVVINAFTHIFGGGGVHIGARTMISTGCSIASITHSEQLATRRLGIESPVTIEEDCWLGTGAIVLPGVRIGRGSVIAAGAVVTRDIPPMSVAMGVPAQVIRQVSPE
jgi:acetyltransferase-like isoleucine patch superfamily enzyme